MSRIDINKIRNMSDEDLERYLRSLSNKNKKDCYVCGKTRTNYDIYIKNCSEFQQKKLCSLCDEHYVELLNHLKINDIDWRL